MKLEAVFSSETLLQTFNPQCKNPEIGHNFSLQPG